MKKSILTLAIAGVLASSAFSQGLIAFSGGISASTRISTNSVVGGPATGRASGVAGTFYMALFASAANTSINGNTAAISGTNANYVFNNLAGWTLVGIATNTTTAGGFVAASQGTSDASQAALNGDGSLSVSSVAGGANAQIVAVAWSATIGSTLTSLEQWYNSGSPSTFGLIGQSAISGALTLGNGALVGTPQAFGPSPSTPGFLIGGVTPTPEPGTLALCALGGASMLLFRRKK